MKKFSELISMREANEIPFKVVGWLNELEECGEDKEFGKIYRGRIIAQDGYGMYTAIIGTTDHLLATPPEETCNGQPYKIMKVEDGNEQ